MDDVVQCRVLGMASLTPPAAEAMGGQVTNLCCTKATLVWMTQGDAKTEAHSHPDGIIIHPQPQ